MAEPDETLIPTPSDYVDAPAADDEMDEELIEEEYYEEEAVEEGDDYDDDEFFEEVVEDSESDEERGESKSGGSQESSEEFDDSTGPPPSGTDLIASENSQPPRTDLETDTDATVGGHTDFADFPPLQEETRSDPPAELPTFADFVSASTGSSDVPTNTTEEVARIIPTDDEENQQSLQFTVTDQGPATAASPSRVIPEIEKETSKSNPFWYWMIFFLVGALLGGGAYVGWYLVNEDRKDAPDLGEERSRAPTPSPTVGLTTAFDPIQGNCDFEDIQNPHVIDQCVCVGEIQIIAEDIRTRYESRKANFIPTIYEDFDDDIAACSPRNQALVWISSGNDFEFSYEERVERFAVAALYASLGGIDWELNNNWLGDDTVCMWEGVTCDQDEMVQILALSDNRLKGRVRMKLRGIALSAPAPNIFLFRSIVAS